MPGIAGSEQITAQIAAKNDQYSVMHQVRRKMERQLAHWIAARQNLEHAFGRADEGIDRQCAQQNDHGEKPGGMPGVGNAIGVNPAKQAQIAHRHKQFQIIAQRKIPQSQIRGEQKTDNHGNADIAQCAPTAKKQRAHAHPTISSGLRKGPISGPPFSTMTSKVPNTHAAARARRLQTPPRCICITPT